MSNYCDVLCTTNTGNIMTAVFMLEIVAMKEIRLRTGKRQREIDSDPHRPPGPYEHGVLAAEIGSESTPYLGQTGTEVQFRDGVPAGSSPSARIPRSVASTPPISIKGPPTRPRPG